MYKVKSLEEFINESFFKNLNVGERASIEAQLQEWSKQKFGGWIRTTPGSWTINNNLTVDVNGHVWLDLLEFKKLPFKFGKVTGTFSVSSCKNLTTLEGCPEEVGKYFFAINTKFTEAKIRKVCKVKGKIYV